MLLFCNCAITRHSYYNHVLDFSGDPFQPRSLPDLGCGHGQDLRILIHERLHQALPFECGISQQLIDLGLDLYRDQIALYKDMIFQADIFATDGRLEAMEGTVQIIRASSLLHPID